MTNPYVAAVHDAADADRVVVALGGGADSAMVLWAAVETGEPVRAVFAFHDLASSQMLSDSAGRVADRLGVDLEVLDAVVDDGPDLEARARRARYEAIETQLTDGDVALTGHTADDQAETVLMRLLRGSGTGGLAGIPERRGPWRRPFLGFGRSELRAAAIRRSLPFADDPANTDDRFLRSRIRHGLLPLIEAEYSSGITSDLVRVADLARADDALIEATAIRIPMSVFAGHLAIPASALVTAPLPVASRAVRSVLRRCGDEYPGSAVDVASVLEVALTGASAVIGGGVRVRRESPMIVFDTGGEARCGVEQTVEGGSFQWAGDRYTVTRTHLPVAVRTAGRFSVMRAPTPGTDLEVRPLRDGDRLDIGTGTTPITELLRDHGVPTMLRSCWLVVTIGGKIAAVHGVRTAAWAMPHDRDEIIIIEGEVHS